MRRLLSLDIERKFPLSISGQLTREQAHDARYQSSACKHRSIDHEMDAGGIRSRCGQTVCMQWRDGSRTGDLDRKSARKAWICRQYSRLKKRIRMGVRRSVNGHYFVPGTKLAGCRT